jgi:arsenite-activated ATPase ArsA/arsenite-activated ATPase ArsA
VTRKKSESTQRKPRTASRKSSGPKPVELPGTHYLFFGGKGGVGKTTAASAAALLLLDEAQGDEQLLLFSTDPAHSLSDSLGIKIGDRLTKVARRGKAQLFALEMDAVRALEEFKNEHRAILQEIAERGTLLDETDINELLDLSLPGMDEVMALFELTELEREGKFARIIVDTAPSGHTSRLLHLPEVFAHMLGALDLMAEKHRYMVAQFVRGGRVRVDEVDLFLRDLGERIERVRAMLYDEKHAAFTLVAIPEAMSVEETARYYATLQAEGVPVTDLIINRVEREHDACAYCRARARGQAKYLKELEEKFKKLRLHQVPLLVEEVRGLDSLREFAGIVWKGEEKFRAKAQRHKESSQRKKVGVAAELSELLEPRRLLIFGGKGGVGKTTAAASAALALAQNNLEARVLVFSTDPAHSLSDSFAEEIGELKEGVAGQANLDASEIDPASRFEELKARYRVWIDELFDTLSGNSGMEIKFDREAMRELVSLAPPGIDEIAALSAISDLLDQSGYTTIVLDTAPTGHLIRFLEMPQVALSWVRAFLKLLLKYKNVVRSGRVAEELITLSKNIKRVAALLTDKKDCEFIGVAIPEQMSLEETIRLTKTLARLKVPVQRLLINNVLPEEAGAACDFCAARIASQRRVIASFRARLRGIKKIYLAAQQPHEINGPKLLREHFASWQAN